jgi:hypothetical protein
MIEVRAFINSYASKGLHLFPERIFTIFGALMGLFVGITTMIRPIQEKLDERKIARKTRDL